MNGMINQITPAAGVEGGEVIISCNDFGADNYADCGVYFGENKGRIVSASSRRVIAAVPSGQSTSGSLRLESEFFSSKSPFLCGERIADNMYSVANPVVDPENDNIFVAYSGSRGQKSDVSIYKIIGTDEPARYLSDVMNVTGMAFDRSGILHFTSRYDGVLYRVTPFNEAEIVAEDLGVATGLAFSPRGKAYVGDRGGTIFEINDLGESRPFALMEPSVSAFHLAFSPSGDLYATGPTVSTFDSVMRINAVGEVTKFYTGLGRPQGLAFDNIGNLYVAASWRGHRGIIKISEDGNKAEVVVAGSDLVGLAFGKNGQMIVVSRYNVYSLPLGIIGFFG